jgi:Holliday junction resolvase RusA-like endonuclease
VSACVKCQHDPDAHVSASWSFSIDRDPPSLNARLFNGPRGWKYRKERNAWCIEVRAVRLLQRIPKATSKRRVTLTRNYYGRQQRRDRDNLAGGMKACVDALVLEGLLRGDSEVDAEIHYAQARTTPAGLCVVIEELAL